jgi:mannose-6-phosphate isomerase-like protein (cupin superfamily)
MEGESVSNVWHGDINQLSERNNYFRKVLFTNHEQLVLMSLKVNEEIGNEVHEDSDQFFRIEKGQVKFIINSKQSFVMKSGGAVVIPAGHYHNVINVGKSPAKLYTVYAPPTHPPNTINKTKPKGD